VEIGTKTNCLTLLEITESKIRTNGKKRPMGLFQCDCGDKSIKAICSVKSGRIKQCWDCSILKRASTITKHGLIKHKLYSKWRDMQNRCYNAKVNGYMCYGGRGIIVCEDWKNNFKSFYDWCMLNGWKKGLSIDRIDPNGNYCPHNCRFVSVKEQAFNKRNTFYVMYKNEKVSLAKLLYEKGMSNKYWGIWRGIKNGKPFEYYINKCNI
jgi:hypothetical protein